MNLLRLSSHVYTIGSTNFDNQTGSSSATVGSIILSLSSSIIFARLFVVDIVLHIGFTTFEAFEVTTILLISSSARDFMLSLFDENSDACELNMVFKLFDTSLFIIFKTIQDIFCSFRCNLCIIIFQTIKNTSFITSLGYFSHVMSTKI